MPLRKIVLLSLREWYLQRLAPPPSTLTEHHYNMLRLRKQAHLFDPIETALLPLPPEAYVDRHAPTKPPRRLYVHRSAPTKPLRRRFSMKSN